MPAPDQTHEVEVVPLGTTMHTAQCSCGWKGTRGGQDDAGFALATRLGQSHLNLWALDWVRRSNRWTR